MEPALVHQATLAHQSADFSIQNNATSNSSTTLHAQQSSVQTQASLQTTMSPSTRTTPPSSSSKPDETDTNNTIWLRIDHIGKYEARFMYYSILLFSIFIVLLALLNMISGISGAIDTTPDSFEDSTYYLVNTIGGAVCLVAILLVAPRFAWRWYKVTYIMKRRWGPRRRAFVIDAAVLLFLGTFNIIFWVTPHVIAILQPSRCGIKGSVAYTLGSMAILRWTFFSMIMMWAVIMVSNMSIHRGCLPITAKNADYLLNLDQPFKKQVKMHRYKVAFWLGLEALVLASFINLYLPAVDNEDEDPNAEKNCVLLDNQCGHTAVVIISVVSQTLLIGVVIIMYIFYLYRALRDHRQLPYAHYKLTNLWLKITKRHTTVLLITISLGVVLVEVVTRGNCIANVQIKFGSLSVNVAVTVYVMYSALIYMPSTSTTVPVQTLNQGFSWTESLLESAQTLRNVQLKASTEQRPKPSLMSRMLSGPLLEMISSRERSHARKKMKEKPMFCVETAVRLFYWTRFAYQHNVPYSLMTVNTALSMYELRHFDYIDEPLTDSKVVFGWNDSVLVLAFRGTQTLKNISHDLKLWSTVYTSRKPELMLQQRQVSKTRQFLNKTLSKLGGGGGGQLSPAFSVAGDYDDIIAAENGMHATHAMQATTTAQEGISTTTSINGISARPHLAIIPITSNTTSTTETTAVRAAEAMNENSKNIPSKSQSSSLLHLQQQRVHSGFFASWLANGFNNRVLDRVSEIFHSEDVMGCMRVLVTGHSLGGALAMLAALDIALENPTIKISCYHWGAPRLFNKAGAAFYDSHVPDTFGLINMEDPIPRMPQLMYKRCGQRVSLNPDTGDLVVAPTFFEVSTLSTSTGSMKQHKTTMYGLSLALFIKSQFFVSKRLPGGKDGALNLLRTCDVKGSLLLENFEVETMKDPTVRPKLLITPVKPSVAVANGSGGGSGNVDSMISVKKTKQKLKKRRWIFRLLHPKQSGEEVVVQGEDGVDELATDDSEKEMTDIERQMTAVNNSLELDDDA